MEFVVTKLLNFITKQQVISTEKDVQDFYKYGIEITISSILNIVLVLALGLLVRHPIESIVYLVLFILVRSFTGGYHADTYFRCNSLMCVTFLLTLCVNEALFNKFSPLFLIILILITEVTVLIFAPIENENKPIESSKKPKLKIIGALITLIMNVLGFILRDYLIGTMVIYTCLLIAMLIVAGKIKEKRGAKNE